MQRVIDAIRRCEAHASHNVGVVPKQITLEEGLSRGVISRLLKKGRWIALYPRAYVVAGTPVVWRTRLAALAASVGEPFAFSHRTAAALLSLDGVPEGSLELITPHSATRDGVSIHRVRGPWPRTVRVDGFPVTTPARTLIDLFAVLPSRAEFALDDALRRRLTCLDRLWSQYAALGKPGQNGAAAFRKALLRRDDRDGTLASRMEAKLRSILRGLPPPAVVPQFPVEAGGKSYRIDFAYPDIKLGIEAQSIKWHLGEARFVNDLGRHRDLISKDWTIIYYAFDDLLRRDKVRREVIELRERLAARLF